MSVSLPTGYYLTRDSSIDVYTNEIHDKMDDGTMRTRILGSEIFEDIRCVFPALTQAQYLSFKGFVASNRGTDIDIPIDGQDYTGRITSGLSVTRRGRLFVVSFTYYAKAA